MTVANTASNAFKPLAVNIETAAEMLDVKDTRIIRRMIQAGEIRGLRIGRRYKVSVESLEALINGPSGAKARRRNTAGPVPAYGGRAAKAAALETTGGR